jgi:hypothetical protein
MGMRINKAWAVAGGLALILATADTSSATPSSSSSTPKVSIAAPSRGKTGFYNQAQYAVIKASHFPPGTSVSFMECAVPSQADPKHCTDSSWGQSQGTTNAKGEFTFSRKTGSAIVLLGDGFFSDPDSDDCGNGPGDSAPCYVTVQDTAAGEADVSASMPYWADCNHFQAYKCFPKAPHN